MLLQFVQFESSLTYEEILAVSRERMPAYQAIPALIQKYYLKLAKPNHYGGVMLWESAEALAAFRDSELAKTIPSAYKVIGTPDISVHEVLFPLRDGAKLPQEAVAA